MDDMGTENFVVTPIGHYFKKVVLLTTTTKKNNEDSENEPKSHSYFYFDKNGKPSIISIPTF
jgi:hypothetical protein